MGRLVLCAAVLFTLCASSASAADRYLSPSGSDSGDCTVEVSPCGTFDYVQDQAAGGDTVHLAAGDYFGGNIQLTKANLTWAGPQAGVDARGRTGPEAQVYVPAFGRGFWILEDGIVLDGITLTSGSGGRAVDAQRGVTIRNVRFASVNIGVALTGGGSSVDRSAFTVSDTGVRTTSAATVQVTNSSFAGGTGISGEGSGALTANGNTFLSGARGISVASTTGTISLSGNRFSPSLTEGLVANRPFIQAANNFWGCNDAPNSAGCATVTGTNAAFTTVTPRLTLTGAVDPASVERGQDAEVQATLRINSDGQDVGAQLVGTPIAFATDGGTLAQPTVAIGADGTARNTLTAPNAATTVTPTVSLDNATVALALDVTAALTADPSAKDFGSVDVGVSSATQTFSVTNSTGAPIRIRTVGLTGADADQFQLWGNACRTTLAPGASCPLSAAMRPTSAGAKHATVAIDASGFADPFVIGLEGMATEGDTLTITPSSLVFGKVSVGGASARQGVTLTNTSTQPLPIMSITTTGDTADFVVSAGDCRTTLAAGASCTITSSFRPQGLGHRAVGTTIRATGQAPRTVMFGGDGVGAALDVTPASRDFGTAPVGSSTRQAFTITNNGATEAPVAIGAIRLTGTGAGAYVLYASGCANRTLAVGQSCEISAYFRPQSTGAKTAAISVVATSQPARTIDLTGAAT